MRRLSLLQHRLEEPIVESDLAKSRAVSGNKRSFGELGAEITRVRIGDDVARIMPRGESLTDQLVEAELLRPCHFDHPVQRCTDGDSGDCLGDVVSGHGLNEYRRQ